MLNKKVIQALTLKFNGDNDIGLQVLGQSITQLFELLISQEEYTKMTLSHNVPVELNLIAAKLLSSDLPCMLGLKDPLQMCIMRVDKYEKLIDTMQSDIKMLKEVNKKGNMKVENNKNVTDLMMKVKNSNDEILTRVVKIESVLQCLLVIPLKKRKSSSDISSETTLTIESLFKRVENIESIIHPQSVKPRKQSYLNLILQ